MGMQKFRAPTLPAPPAQYDQSYLMQLVRTLGIYFDQIDSNTAIRSDTAQFTAVPNSDGYNGITIGSLYRGVGEDILRVKVNGIPYTPAVTNAYLNTQLASALATAEAYTDSSVANYLPLTGGTLSGTLYGSEITATTVNASTLSSTNATISNASTGAIRAPGMMLQVQQTIKTDTYTQASTGNTYYTVPNLAVTITPTSATSKILVMCTVYLGSQSYQGRGIVYRNGTPIGLGDNNGDRTGVSFGFNAYDSGTSSAGDQYHCIPCNFTFLDTPATTDPLTYTVGVSCYGVYGISVNRPWTWQNFVEYDPCFSSTITVIEIAG